MNRLALLPQHRIKLKSANKQKARRRCRATQAQKVHFHTPMVSPSTSDYSNLAKPSIATAAAGSLALDRDSYEG